ncbi:calpain-A-like [Ornithodoros turicata]|uniref:calpain-A-like n=1 Tax=Ornithodoros turicata TaxID=34597 RepID=UPI003139C560
MSKVREAKVDTKVSDSECESGESCCSNAFGNSSGDEYMFDDEPYSTDPLPLQVAGDVLAAAALAKQDEPQDHGFRSSNSKGLEHGGVLKKWTSCSMSKAQKVYRYGESGSGIRTKDGIPQYYENIIEQCFKENRFFEDPEFPCEDSSIGIKEYAGRIIWKRPYNMVEKPQFFVDGVSRHDIFQMTVADCWFVAALASLTEHKELFDRVVPQGQSFKRGSYAGVFHFVFWRNNRWVDVVIDDRLPMFEKEGSYMGVMSSVRNEFWGSLVEKAYAKLHGSYGSLQRGNGREALTDLTGGIPELIAGIPLPEDTWNTMKRAFERKSIMTAYFQQQRRRGEGDGGPGEIEQDDGLMANHVYSVTGLTQFNLEGTEQLVRLLRLRNPYGHKEYTGPWSDVSEQWKKVSRAKLEELGVTVRDDGEFWIEADYFLKRFMFVEMCHLNPASLEKDPDAKCWETATFEGSWVTGVSAGGSSPSNDKYSTNPQYFVTLRGPDSEDQDGKCSMLVSLRQKTERVANEGGNWLYIGVAIFEVKDPEKCEKPLPLDYLIDHTINLGQYWNSRDVTNRQRLLPGTYCVVPYTKEPDTDCDFLLRIFTEQKSECRECDGGNVCAPK